MNKIVRVVTEPSPVYIGQEFKLRVKAIRGLTFEELKELTFTKVTQYTFGELKGE